MAIKPPKYIHNLLDYFCPDYLFEGISGDLEEQFKADLEKVGARKARWNYAVNALRFLRPGILFRNKIKSYNYIMFRNYIKIAFRNLWKARLHSAITILGLAVGIACCVLIALFVKDEWTFDQFHSKSDRIYRMWVFEDYGKDEQFFNATTPYPLGPALKESFSEVETFVRYNQIGQSVTVNDQIYNENVSVVSPEFFTVFDFQNIQGDPNSALKEKNSIVLTESIATKYFSYENPIGKTVEMDFGNGVRAFSVKAVMQDPPSNSSFQFELLISDLNNDELVSERALQNWYNVSAETYVLLQPGVNDKELESKIPTMVKKVLGENFVEGEYNVGFQQLADIHLNTDMPTGIAPVSDPKYAFILAGIAILILLLGSINFVTLSMSRSLNRSKEVGIRKAIGARKNQLMTQFLSEAVVTTFIALCLGVLLSILVLPLFNDLASKELVLEASPFILIVLFSLLTLIGVIAGSYPALILSSSSPQQIFNGQKSSGNSKQTLRKVLTGFQFVLTIFLISSTILMQQQLNFIQNKNLGFDKEHVLVTQLTVDSGQGLNDVIKKAMNEARLFKNKLADHPVIKEIGVASHTFGTGGWTNVGYTDADDNYRTFDVLVTDEKYIPAMNMEMAEGRIFNEDNTSDKRRSIIVNEAFVKSYGWEGAVGKRIPGKNFDDHEIIGVVKNFNYNSLHGEVDPLVMTMNYEIIDSGLENIGIGSNPVPKLMVRADGKNIAEAIQAVKSTWKEIKGEEEFNYTFVDETLAAQYSQEQNLSKIVAIASALALIIGCMGLFALASLTMQSRTKEISIRKVHGASLSGIIALLTKDYLFLMLAALVVAIPVTLLFINNWLDSFAFKITPGADVFLITGIITIVIALLTIAYHAINTAKRQPAEVLKYE